MHLLSRVRYIYINWLYTHIYTMLTVISSYVYLYIHSDVENFLQYFHVKSESVN